MGMLAKVGAAAAALLPNVGRAALRRVARLKHLQDWATGTWIDAAFPMNWFQMNLAVAPEQNGTVNACVQAYAWTIAQLPVKHYRKLPTGGRELVTNSSLHRVMRRPNVYCTTSDFLLMLVNHLFFRGNFYAVAEREDGEIVALHPLNPSSTQPQVDREFGDLYYHAYVEPVLTGSQPFDAIIPGREVLHVRMYSSPENPLVGITPIAAATTAVNSNDAIGKFQEAFYSRMQRPSGILSTDQSMTGPQMDEVQERWEQKSKGMDAGGVPILTRGLKFQQVSLSSADAQLIEGYRLTVEEIARVMRVPVQMIDSSSGTTYGNVEQFFSFWRLSSLGFVVNHIEQALHYMFRLPDDEEVEMDLDVLLRSDLKTQMEALGVGTDKGLLAHNEARNKINLPDVEGGEMPMVQRQMVPLNVASNATLEEPAPAPAPNPDGGEPPDSGQLGFDIGEDAENVIAIRGYLRERLKAS